MKRFSKELTEEDLDAMSSESDNSSSKNTKSRKIEAPKSKTFNRLAERFQWRPELDDNHIFPEEYSMIAQLRKEFGSDVQDWSDKYLLYFIFARRHDMELTKELLQKHLAKLKEYGFDKRTLTVDDCHGFKSGSNLYIKGAVDKYERLVTYYKMRYDEPKTIDLKQKYAMLFWDTRYRCEIEPIRYLRNGMLIVGDLGGFGWKNIDLSPESKEYMAAMSGVFPRRLRDLVAVNGGPLLRLIMKAGKVILPKKIMKRVHVIDKKALKDLIPDQWLPVEYGGSLKLTTESMLAEMRQYDQCWVKKH